MKRRFLLGFMLVGLAVSIAIPASAHALLVRSTPEANAELSQAPQQVDLYFSEGLEAAFSSANVLNTDGKRVDNNDAAVDPSDATHMSLTLKPLPDGVYTVSWKAISTSDGHLTNGTFPFAVGSGNAAALAAAASSTGQGEVAASDVILSWILYLAAAVAVGGALFRLWVWDPSWASADMQNAFNGQLPWPRMGRISLLMLAGVMALALLVQGGKATGTLLALPWSAALKQMLFTSRFGGLWSLRLVLSMALVGLLWNASSRRQLWLAFAAGAGILLTISLGSHAAADASPYLPVASDWIHLMAASIWLGGLSHFALGMWRVRTSDAVRRTRLTANLIPRFTRLALPSVAVLAITGLYAAYQRVGTLSALLETLYGHVLIVKVAITLVMIGLGAVNFLIMTPRMRKGAGQAGGDSVLVGRFRRIVSTELVLGVGLLLAVGVLTAAPPAALANAAPAITQSTKADDLSIELKIEPGKVGLNVFTVSVASAGQPVEDAKQVQLKFTPISNLAPSTLDLPSRGGGQYIAKAANLSQAAEWQIQVAVRRENKFDSFANFTINLGGAKPSTFPWGRTAGGLLILGGFALVFASGQLGLNRWQRALAGMAPAMALALAGAWVFYHPPPPPQSSLANPIAPNETSVAAGKALYQTNCVPCHGQSGKGDGPVGLTLNPRPADLTYHATPGVHSDGQLFGWITNGYPGSAMPAFKAKLSDTDRWNLVNYIRTLAPVPQ
jgi:copper transport protein